MGKLIRKGEVITGAVDMNIVSVTKEQYANLPYSKNYDGKIYDIVDSNIFPDADRIKYDNATSKLSATNVQSAIDELKSGLNSYIQIKTNSQNGNGSNLVNYTIPSLPSEKYKVLFTICTGNNAGVGLISVAHTTTSGEVAPFYFTGNIPTDKSASFITVFVLK